MHLKLIRLLDDHLQAAVLSQDRLPHLSYPASFLLFGAQLSFHPICKRQEGGRERGME